jgi:hypothetical protein
MKYIITLYIIIHLYSYVNILPQNQLLNKFVDNSLKRKINTCVEYFAKPI